MKSIHFLPKLKLFISVSALLTAVCAFSQSSPGDPGTSRSEVNYKQLHSSGLSEQSGLYADGIKLKIDLSKLEEAQKERDAAATFDENEIPADDIYGGLWPNNHVAVYGSLKNVPDTFLVDVTNFTMPCTGYMTSNFGRRGRRGYHCGVDLKAQTGDTIYAAFDGKVRVKQFERRGYGYYLVIRHVNGLETVYGHLSGFLVEENDFVHSGDPIGLAGNTGRSTGAHLHFETRFLGKVINPNLIIDFENHVPHRDEYLVSNASYNRTNKSSRSVVKSELSTYPVASRNANSNYKKSVNGTNRYVSGDVKYHRIKKGDTLGAIARRYGVSVNKICSLNNITPTTTLRIGKSLRLS